MKTISTIAFVFGLVTTCYAQKSNPAEFADLKYAEIGKSGLTSLASGDIDGWMKTFADNAVYAWNAGDSIVGKTAITNYWKRRRSEIIESIKFSNEIFLPLKVNQPQSVEEPGIWLLGWYMVEVTYKTGKKMTQWLHVDSHFNADDKIDRQIMYIDRVPVNAATSQ